MSRQASQGLPMRVRIVCTVRPMRIHSRQLPMWLWSHKLITISKTRRRRRESDHGASSSVLSYEQWGFFAGPRGVHIGVVHSCSFIFRKNIA
jgi:hypothetical protein